MSRSSRPEPKLEALEPAKIRFNTALKPRMDEYKRRKNISMLKRGLAYINTGNGTTGFKRTESFLTAMNEANIDRTERLIDLTKNYVSEGKDLPLLLQKTVLEICGFDTNHVAIIEKVLIAQILSETRTNKYALLKLQASQRLAIESIYGEIIKSADYGNQYLAQLNQQVRQAQTAKPR